jgi:hypothetical protein
MGFTKQEHAKLTEQLIDLYLSVKIRSNEEVTYLVFNAINRLIIIVKKYFRKKERSSGM